MKRTIIFSICCSLLVLGGFGCKGLSQEQQTAIRPVTVEYWVVDEGAATIEAFAAEYRQFRPYVNIAVRRVRQDQLAERFITALADDNPPDIISVPVRELDAYRGRLQAMPRSVQVANVFTRGGLAKETVIEPVVNAMPSTLTISRNYIRAVEENAIVSNRVYGLPLAVDTMALYINRELLDNAGVPELPESWDEFTDAVKDTTRFSSTGEIVQSGVALGTASNIDNAFDVLSLLWLQNGVDLDSVGTNALLSGVRNSGTRTPTFESLRFYTDFARADRDVYSWNESQPDALDQFIQNRSAFYFGFASEQDEINRRAPQMQLEIVPLPQLDPTNPKNVIDFRLQAVPAQASDPDEAWDFIRYMSQPQNIERYLGATNMPTPLRSQITPQSEIPEMAPFLTGILTATNWYQGRDMTVVNRALERFLTGYMAPYSEDVDPEERDVFLLDTFVRTVEQSQ